MCKEFGWTYIEYLNTPQWFIETYNITKAKDSELASKK